MAARQYLTVGDIRLAVEDRRPEDNEHELDLYFSDEEVLDAMARAAREYNSIEPIGVHSVNPRFLPNDTNVLLMAVLEQLYLSRLARVSRNDFDYSAGGVSTNTADKQIKHLRQLKEEAREAWEPRARSIKVAHNLRQAYWSV